MRTENTDAAWLTVKAARYSPPGLIKKTILTFTHLVAFFFVMLLPLALLIPYSILIYMVEVRVGLWSSLLAVLPLSALYILSFYLSVAMFKWILVGRMSEKNIPLDSFLYIRKWIVDSLIMMSLYLQRSMYATLYLPPWLRLTGARIGKRTEISTVNHLSVDLLRVKEGFLADSVTMGPPVIINRTMLLRSTTVGVRSFIGNSSVVPAGGKVEDGCLIGVLSTTPDSGEAGKKKCLMAWIPSCLSSKPPGKSCISGKVHLQAYVWPILLQGIR